MSERERPRRGPEPDTGESAIIAFPSEDGVSSSSARRSSTPVQAPRLLPILAIVAALAGAALSLAVGPRSYAAAILGWVLAGPVPAVLIIVARRITLERSASSRFAPRTLDERLLVVALVALAAAALAASLVLGPWFARW